MSREPLGEVTVPSGTLTILDPGHIGMYLAEEIPSVPVVEITGVPRDRVLPVIGERCADAEFGERWAYVAIVCSEAAIASSRQIGEAIVDFARLLIADAGNAESWIHVDSMDGKADFVFWGRDADALAAAIGAPALADGNHGWKDLPVDEAVDRGTAAEALMAERGWKLATDFRPHSHHWALLEQVRASPTESGVLDIDGRRVCLFMTSWGDGTFPIVIDRASDGSLVRVRIELCEPDSD